MSRYLMRAPEVGLEARQRAQELIRKLCQDLDHPTNAELAEILCIKSIYVTFAKNNTTRIRNSGSPSFQCPNYVIKKILDRAEAK